MIIMAYFDLADNFEGFKSKFPNTSALALSMQVMASQFWYLPLVRAGATGSKGKVNNTSGVSQNAEAAAGGSSSTFKRLKGLHS